MSMVFIIPCVRLFFDLVIQLEGGCMSSDNKPLGSLDIDPTKPLGDELARIAKVRSIIDENEEKARFEDFKALVAEKANVRVRAGMTLNEFSVVIGKTNGKYSPPSSNKIDEYARVNRVKVEINKGHSMYCDCGDDEGCVWIAKISPQVKN